ncbi:hypothetical protein ANN_05576 [Periplaneta americana]|uniref:Uncharacterized protein n=1 Tax=Periplaneta americana TaxID=6978 RepID=A0ABQ8TCI0_PERAM|nr:hypothetical protein ANN_05576 [Periplaneta americana]
MRMPKPTTYKRKYQSQSTEYGADFDIDILSQIFRVISHSFDVQRSARVIKEQRHDFILSLLTNCFMVDVKLCMEESNKCCCMEKYEESQHLLIINKYTENKIPEKIAKLKNKRKELLRESKVTELTNKFNFGKYAFYRLTDNNIFDLVRNYLPMLTKYRYRKFYYGGDDDILKISRQLVFFPPLYKGFRNDASRSEEETDEIHFHLFKSVNKQNFQYWAEENPKEINMRPLHSERVTVWCCVSQFGFIGRYLFESENGGFCFSA